MSLRSVYFIVFLLVMGQCLLAQKTGVAANDRPNVILIFTDDQGYNDVGVFGADDIDTPNLDQMAKDGAMLTHFYAAQAVCSASRAGILTGTYPNRIGIHNAFMPNSKVGLNPDETTLAELLKAEGYATAIFGKWHLGDAKEFMPNNQGFDEYYGIP
ncbi:MAG TPA: arylsulfatase, partial [Maribacter sp.]|nr:arylsulfatase [Maribacter sp.]